MKYVVTGGCGFIGSHLVDALIDQGHSVLVLDDLSSGCLDNLPEEARFLIGDVANPEYANRAMQDGVDGCFHLAAIASVELGNRQWVATHRTNVTGAVSILDAAREKSVPVVYASSAAVYGDNGNLLSEELQPRPLSAYGADKYGCELHAAVASHVHNVPNIGLRFFNVYGPRQDPRSPYSGVITLFKTKLTAGEPITINGDGNQTRDLIYVNDVVRGLIAAMERCHTRMGNEVFNLCTGIETSIIDLAHVLAEVMGVKPCIRHGPPRPGDPRRSVGDYTKAFSALKFKPQVDLLSGLKLTIYQPETRNSD